MSAIASQITSLTIVYSTVYSDADQRQHQSSASLAFVWGIHRGPVNFLHKWPVTRKMFPFDDVIMFTLRLNHISAFVKHSLSLQHSGQCVLAWIIAYYKGRSRRTSKLSNLYWMLSIGRNSTCQPKVTTLSLPVCHMRYSWNWLTITWTANLSKWGAMTTLSPISALRTLYLWMVRLIFVYKIWLILAFYIPLH